MNSIYNKYIEARQKDIASYIEDNIVDGDIPDDKGRKFVFLATNGSWQTKYLSLYEMLHDKYIAKYCAKLLLEEYLEKHYALITETQTSGLSKEEVHLKLYNEVAFTKIITVTVSSQLIGVALRNLIRDDTEKKYFFLTNPKESNRLKSCPELLRLSSYYSFDEEKPFRDITEKDKVIVVNDVISTGNLIYKIFNKIRGKQAQLNAVFSIADTRVNEPLLLQNLNLEVKNGQENAIESHYIFGTIDEERLFFTLVKCDEKEHAIRKYQRPYRGTSIVKRINPLLNTIVELETKHSEEKRVLFRKPEKLLTQEIINESHFKIGHFRQNLSHNGYLTDMHNLFSTDGDNSPGEKLLDAIKIRLDKFLSEQQPTVSIINAIIQNINFLQHQDLGNENLNKASNEMATYFEAFNKTQTDDIIRYKPDYIFFPPFSGIEQLSESVLHKCFGTPVENIICLQRFDTNKGWRFPFPAKWYNHLTKDKSILILDSGSLTGESLVQLVDTVSFLDVREITVLCAITRIEDFYREFYSRLKFSKVKILQTDDSLTEDEKAKQPEHIIPLNIIFGTNLNIPVFPSKVSCPFCEEIRELSFYKEKANLTEPSEWTLEYLRNRIVELSEINLEALEEYKIPDYLPLIKKRTDDETKAVDSLALFLMRDMLGKVDSYRFYKDYFDYFDKLKIRIDNNGLYDEENLKDIELILTLVLHEPKLLRTINDLLIDISDYCHLLIDDIVFQQTKSIEAMNYKWSEYSIIRLAIIMFPKKFKNVAAWIEVFAFSLNNKQAMNYLSFLLWEGFLGMSKLLSNQEYIDLISIFSDELDSVNNNSNLIYKNKIFRKIIKGITNKFSITQITSLNIAYFNLRKFFFGQSSSNTHNDLIKALTRFESIVKNEEKANDDLQQIFKLIQSISNHLFYGLLDNLNYIKKSDSLKNYHQLQYSMLFNGNGVYQNLIIILQEIEKVIHEKQQIVFDEDYKTLNNLYESINQFYLMHIHETSAFCNYCKEYKADLINAIFSSFSSNSSVAKFINSSNNRILICDNEVDFSELPESRQKLRKAIFSHNKIDEDEPIHLCITKSFLEDVLDEIFINAIKHSETSIVEVEIAILKLSESTSVKFMQKIKRKDFSNSKIVSDVLSAFCGEGNVLFYDDPFGNYTIEATFNNEQLTF